MLHAVSCRQACNIYCDNPLQLNTEMISHDFVATKTLQCLLVTE